MVSEFKGVKNREKNELKNYYKEEYNSLEADPLCEKISTISDNRLLVLVSIGNYVEKKSCGASRGAYGLSEVCKSCPKIP